jgi:hypothetical protein
MRHPAELRLRAGEISASRRISSLGLGAGGDAGLDCLVGHVRRAMLH